MHISNVQSLTPKSQDDTLNCTLTRVASVKAMSEASRFFNASQITMDLVITTKDDGQSNITTEMLEEINPYLCRK